MFPVVMKSLAEMQQKGNLGLEFTQTSGISFALLRLGRKVEALPYLERRNEFLKIVKSAYALSQRSLASIILFPL